MRSVCFFILALFSLTVFAQPGNNDDTFNPGDFGNGYGDGLNGVVNVAVKQSDGKIIIGGAFTTCNGASSSRIARLNADGSTDATFTVGTGFNNDVWAIAIQSDGKIIVGGYFTLYNGTVINRIIRLNSDGTRDISFTPGTGASSYVLSAAVQSDGKIVIAGNFTTYNGTASNYIARLNSDGTYDTGFTPGTGANAQIQTALIQSDGKIVISGAFTSYNGTSRNYIARLNSNGAIDATFNPGTGASATVLTTAIQSDGKILIGGSFTSFNGTAKNRIARLTSAGAIDNTLNIGTGASSTVNSISIQTDGKIVFCGDFTSYNGSAVVRVARINSDGSIDNSFNTGAGANTYVSAVVLQSDGKVILGGFFGFYDGTPRNRIARLNTDGSLDESFGAGTGAISFICAVVVQSDGKVIIGGDFTSYNGTTINRIARLNDDGTLDPTFNPGTGANAIVYSVALQSNGKIIIGGDFTTYNGLSQNGIARLNSDGTIDNTFSVGTGANASVYALAIQGDGKVIAGGNFTSYNGTAKNRIIRINTDGSIDNTFAVGTGANAAVNSLAIQSDGKVIVGGNFTSYSGTAVNRLVRLSTTASIDGTFNVGTGAGSYVLAIAIQSDNKIIIGGSFTTYNGTGINRIARLNSAGTLDSGFNPGTGANNDVRTVLIQSDGRIFIAGNFTTYNGVTRNRVLRLNSDGTENSSFSIGAGANGLIRASALQSDQKIIIGGEFTNYKGTGRNRAARIYNCSDTYKTITVTECDSYTAPDGVVYTTSGVKTAIIPNSALCDSIITINLTIKNSTSSAITASGCGSYTAPDGMVYTTSGVKTATIPNLAGCDSVITINLTINTNTASTITVSACGTYTAPDGMVYNTSGVKTAVIPNAAGCDSTITINLTIKSGTASSISVTECDSYTSPDGVVYTTSGVKTAVITNAAGCDSIITINLTIIHSTSAGIVATVCDTYTAPDGVLHTTSGIKTAVIPNAAGCDSVITINLTVKHSTTSTISVSACESYTAPDGLIYTTSGVKTATIANEAGCDSTITINLTIGHNNSSSVNVTSCGSYTAPDGQVYSSPGTYTATILNSESCDSTITINLTIGNGSTSSITEVACDSYTAPDGSVYTTSGVKTAVISNAAGCDSTITINLTINNSSASSFTVNTCGDYTAPDGTIHTSPGTFNSVIQNSSGCDSTITITLNILPVYQNQTVCMVTVDTVLWKNRVVWDKPAGTATEFFNIYRENSVYVYDFIGTVPIDSPSVFLDQTSVPGSYDHKYKISAVDSCGNESARSPYHKTMFLFISASNNNMMLNWTEYYDESGMFIPTKYYIYRGTQPDNMVYLDTVNGFYANYVDSNIFSSYYYMVGTVKYPSCPGFSDTSYSNYVSNNVLVGINHAVEYSGKLEIYPNPMTTSATLTIPNLEIRNQKSEKGGSSFFEFRISDLTGRAVKSFSNKELMDIQINSSSGLKIQIERGELKPGIYFAEIITDRLYRVKFIVE